MKHGSGLPWARALWVIGFGVAVTLSAKPASAGNEDPPDAPPGEQPKDGPKPKSGLETSANLLAPGEQPEPQPLQLRYPPTSVRWGLIGGGGGLTVAAYTASLIAAYTSTDIPGIDKLKIPVIGPWWTLGQSACPETDPECGAALYLRGIAYVFDGLFQLGGLGIMAEGIFMTTEAEPTLPAPEVSFVPLASPEITGLGIVGTF